MPGRRQDGRRDVSKMLFLSTPVGVGMDTLDELAANVFAIPPSYREFEMFV